MRLGRLLPLVLIAALLATGAVAQDGPELSLAFGIDGTEYLDGLVMEGRFSTAEGAVAHQLGASVVPENAIFGACWWSPCRADEPLVNIFYEPHLRWARGPEHASPYLGLRVTVARGWDGFGGGMGLVAGLEGAGRGFRRFDLIVDYLRMTAVGSSGHGWSGWRVGLRYGRGLRLGQSDDGP